MNGLLASLDRFFSWLVSTSWQASVLVLLVLGAQHLFRRQLSTRWRYALWLLVILRLLLPALPQSRVSLERITSMPQQAALAELAKLPPFVPKEPGNNGPLSAAPAKASAFFHGIRLYTSLWLAGVLLFGGVTLLGVIRFKLALRFARPCEEDETLDLARSCAAELGVTRRVRLVETSSVSGPAVVGIFRPTLLLPEGLFEAFTREELRIIFLHELAHLRRGDTIINTLAAILQILHWFNPFLWVAFARMRHDREMATDALVLSGTRAPLKSIYAHTLVKLLETFSSPAYPPRLIGIMENHTYIQERLTRIKNATPGAYRWSIFGAALTVAIGVVALTQATGHPPTSGPEKSNDSSASASRGKTSSASGDSTSWYLEGTKLTTAEVASLEAQVAANPDDLAARVKILGYYSLHRIFNEEARAATQPHILWIIRNRPASEVAGRPVCHINARIDPARYKEGAEAWEEQIVAHSKDARVIGNAANFFILANNKRAEELLLAAKKLEPDNREWDSRLGRLYSLRINDRNPETAHKNATQALQSYEDAAKGQTGEKLFYTLSEVTEAAYKAGDMAKARATAEELLKMAPDYKKDWNYGNAIYTGNSVLGLVALSEGNIDAARNHLLAAGDTPGSPQLDSFGPDLALAQALLDRGEDKTVLTFLDKISKFWKQKESKINAWQEAIRQGNKPKLDRFGF